MPRPCAPVPTSWRGWWPPWTGTAFDLWITPAATGPAPYGLKSTGDFVMSLPWSYAGAPALALPAGRAANSLPLGVQCVARPGADERLLGWAPDVESVLVGPTAPV
nr:amidase family protein [Streptomyces sabulosicollis]